MKKRDGASLLNVMVFMLFAVMITAQVFFFAKWQADSVAEEREIMMYRLNLDSLVEVAKEQLAKTGNGEISHDTRLNLSYNAFTFSDFYNGTRAKYKAGSVLQSLDATPSEWRTQYNNTYNLTIHDLDYIFDSTFSGRTDWAKQSGTSMDRKVFAAIIPDSRDRQVSRDIEVTNDEGETITQTITETEYDVTARYYLIRAWAKLPENYYGRKLMYQVLVKRSDDIETPVAPNPRKVQVLSFQEVWF